MNDNNVPETNNSETTEKIVELDDEIPWSWLGRRATFEDLLKEEEYNGREYAIKCIIKEVGLTRKKIEKNKKLSNKEKADQNKKLDEIIKQVDERKVELEKLREELRNKPFVPKKTSNEDNSASPAKA